MGMDRRGTSCEIREDSKRKEHINRVVKEELTSFPGQQADGKNIKFVLERVGLEM